MSKIVKYCGSCEEGFAEKFGFCPNCGSQLEAFAMNPVNDLKTEPVKAAEKLKNEIIIPAERNTENLPPINLAVPPIDPIYKEEIKEESAPVIEEPIAAPPIPVFVAEKTPEVVTPIVEEPVISEPPVFEQPQEVYEAPKTFAAAASSTPKATDVFQTPANDSQSSLPAYSKIEREFYVTVIEEKNAKQRNVLLLGSLLTMIVLILAGTVYSLFHKDLFVGSINEGDLIASVPAVVPDPVDEVPPPKKDNDKGGGGGGGGKQQDQDPSKGRLPPQVKDPATPPDPNITRITNPAIPLSQATKGNIPREVTDENTGVPTGLARNGSSGRGSGGGIGNGFGTGVGNGRGTGEGNGIGSGSGNGIGTGTGNNTGSGGNGTPPPPPEAPKAGPSKGVTITSKPRANYTDAARQAQVQGTVTLKVIFLANGQIGGVSAVSGLPNGLTEQAIAAARGIRFEPAMKNGVAQTVTKSVQYSFTIY